MNYLKGNSVQNMRFLENNWDLCKLIPEFIIIIKKKNLSNKANNFVFQSINISFQILASQEDSDIYMVKETNKLINIDGKNNNSKANYSITPVVCQYRGRVTSVSITPDRSSYVSFTRAQLRWWYQML